MLVQNYISGRTSVNIARSIEEAVAAGKASAGEQLPAVRALAVHLGVSPATVSSAYRLLQEALPQTMVVSIGHRSTLRAFHRTELTMTGDGHWDLKMLQTGTASIVE